MAVEWIGVDWGTSHLRAWKMRDGDVLDHRENDAGMARLDPAAFEPALLDLVAPWLSERKTTVIACGMVGARQGWSEAAYRAVPCPPTDVAALTRVPISDPRLDVMIAPGLCQDDPADVMRGEETQIEGALRLAPGFDGVICLPGTHTKWVHVSAGEVVSFRTFLTGELFDLLSNRSILRHTTGTGWDDAAFDNAVRDALSRPELFSARLFSLRAEGLLHGLPGNSARARISGLLIGLELAGAKPYWLGQAVMLVGAPELSALYARALTAQGARATRLDATACTVAGLTSLCLKLKGC